MKTIQFLTVIPIISLLCISQTRAQSTNNSVIIKSDTVKIVTVPSDDSVRKKSHFTASLEFQSNDVYMGRQDSSALPYFIPTFGYYAKSGLFVSASVNYLSTMDISRIDLFTINAGYLFAKGNYDGTFTLSKYFYNSQSTSVTSEIQGSVNYDNGYDFGFLRTSLSLNLNIGSQADFAAEFGIEHTIHAQHDKLEITPTLTAGASTQNFYSDYFKKKLGIQRAGKKSSGSGSISGTIPNANAFKLLAYQASLPIAYATGKLKFSFTPYYSIPLNAALVDLHMVSGGGQVVDKSQAESIANTFWWTAGVSINF
jgi:hypothetical protein